MNRCLLDELRSAQELVLDVCESLEEDTLRSQFHPELSPLGWHLGHCAFTESFWVQEIIQQNDRVTAPLRELYTPPLTPKSERGKRIPAAAALMDWVRTQQSINLETLAAAAPVVRKHPLMTDEYLVHFLIQHYSQHYENMLMVLTQRALLLDTGDHTISSRLTANGPRRETSAIDAGEYRVGGKVPRAYDNELPPQSAHLEAYQIGVHPVCNSGYLAFIEDGGYTRRDLWSETGWQWLQQHKCGAPQHWRKNAAGEWYGIDVHGSHDLHGEAAVHGISRHEAGACATWAGGGLPHEHQWEVACRLQRLEYSGAAWEWCDNLFYPYEGFRPFPYNEYSQAWFDSRHYTLRGGSAHTQPALKRASFRNFYTADKRHIFAGLRLVFATGSRGEGRQE